MTLPDWLNSFLNRLHGQAGLRAVDQPLLNDIELHLIQRLALATADNPFLMQRDVQHPLLGERSSSFAGSGYEFAEHRRYVSGDDMRFIDWRVMARTGKLHRKVFHEERRPQLYLLVDRRAPMRYGTRQQLKVSCAVRHAIRLLYQARQQQLLIGSVLLEDQAHWLKASQSTLETHHTIQQLNRPCPPLPFQAGTVELAAVLSELAVRLTPGCIIYLISDLHDLDEQAGSTLFHLAQQHQLYAWQILDPVELTLPDASHAPLYDDVTGGVLNIDTGNAALRQQFHDAMQARQQKVKSLIENAGGSYRLCMTDGNQHG